MCAMFQSSTVYGKRKNLKSRTTGSIVVPWIELATNLETTMNLSTTNAMKHVHSFASCVSSLRDPVY